VAQMPLPHPLSLPHDLTDASLDVGCWVLDVPSLKVGCWNLDVRN
jgi:hypothetical protein